MPAPIVIALWIAGGALASRAAYDGYHASDKMSRAKDVGERAERSYDKALAAFDQQRDRTQCMLTDLGRVKTRVFTHQIKHLVDALKKGRSRLSDYEISLSSAQMREYERLVLNSLEMEKGLLAGGASGALAALGAYGLTGTFATATTGTAISTLSGIAAKNATLAWLGGGALTAGGGGVFGGMVALGGVALGPALAIGAFMMHSQAEEALTDARRYEARVDEAVGEMELGGKALEGIRMNAAEVKKVIERLAEVFERVKVANDDDPAAFQRMIMVGNKLKEALDIQIVTNDGGPASGVKARCSGLLEVVGPEVA